VTVAQSAPGLIARCLSLIGYGGRACSFRRPRAIVDSRTKGGDGVAVRVMESLHVPVTTQLYFKRDPFLANDPWAGHKPSLAIDLKQDGKLRRGGFDVVLARGL